MRFEYWNHPLVVSAFRVRFRGRTPGAAAMVYFLALLGLGGLLEYNLANDPTTSWVLLYFVALLAIENAVAALFATMSTFQSIHNEVVNRTLDYQRTAAIGPHEMLFAKMLGEPAQGYLATLAGLPLLVWCVAMGATTLPIFVLLLINLVTTSLLFASLGLIHPLDTSVERSKVGGRSVRGLAVAGIFVSIQVFAMTPQLAQSPLGQAALGLLTPAVSIYGVAMGNPLDYCLHLFGFQIPFLLVTPVAQVAVALMVVHSIARRLISPLNTALSKPLAYCALLAMDVLAASMLASQPALSVERVVAGFCLAHLVASVLLTMAVSPGRETIKTWIWRFRGRLPLWKDFLWGPRSENLGPLLVFCLIGLLTAVALALSVDGTTFQVSDPTIVWAGVAKMISVTSVVLLGYGMLYQWLFSINNAGSVMFVGMIAMFSLVPHLIGYKLNNPWILSFSPSAQFGNWLYGATEMLPVTPILGLYGLIFLVMQRLNARRMTLGIAAVEKKLALMLTDSDATSVAER